MRCAIAVLVGLPFAVLTGDLDRIAGSTSLPSIAGEVCVVPRAIARLLTPAVSSPLRRKLGDLRGRRGAGELAEARRGGLAEQHEGVTRPLCCLDHRWFPEGTGSVLASAGSSCGGGR